MSKKKSKPPARLSFTVTYNPEPFQFKVGDIVTVWGDEEGNIKLKAQCIAVDVRTGKSTFKWIGKE